MRRGGGALDERGVVRVDVRGLDVDQALGIVRRGPEAFAEELGDDFDELGVQSGEPLELLSEPSGTSSVVAA